MTFTVVYHAVTDDAEPLLTLFGPLPIPVPDPGDEVTLVEPRPQVLSVTGVVEKRKWLMRPDAEGELHVQVDVWLTVLVSRR